MFDRMVNEGLTERAILESGNEGIEGGAMRQSGGRVERARRKALRTE